MRRARLRGFRALSILENDKARADSVTMIIYPVQIRENENEYARTATWCPAIALDIPKKTFDELNWRELGGYIDRECRKRLPERRSAYERYQDGIHHLDVFIASTTFETYLCSITLYSTEGNYAITNVDTFRAKNAQLEVAA